MSVLVCVLDVKFAHAIVTVKRRPPASTASNARPPLTGVCQAYWLAAMPKSQVEITIGKLPGWFKIADFANEDEDNAASDASAADIFMNLRRLYITANIKIRFTNLIYCIFNDTMG
jgi:hypothetical protein